MTKIIIIGTSSAGATCAARLRRLNIHCDIAIYEKRTYMTLADDSYLAYLKDEIHEIAQLQLLSQPIFQLTRQLEVKLGHEVLSINPQRKAIKYMDYANETIGEDVYDLLILATGASIPTQTESEYQMDKIEDLEKLKDCIQKPQQSIMIAGHNKGAVELADYLKQIGHEVTLSTTSDRLLAEYFDDDLSQFLQKAIYDAGIKLMLNQDELFEADLNISYRDKQAESRLADEAGIALASNGGIIVDDQFRTSQPDIYAIGSCALAPVVMTGQQTLDVSEGYKQQGARKLANQLLVDSEERSSSYLKSKIVTFQQLKYGAVGMTCRDCQKQGIDYGESLVIPGDMLRLRPEARPIYYKLIYAKEDGLVLGLQVMAYRDVSKDLDVISAVIYNHNTVYDMKEYQLSYSPEYSNPKEASNIAALNAINMIEGRVKAVMIDEVRDIVESHSGIIFDTRSKSAFEAHHIEGSHHLSYEELHERLEDLPKDKPIYLYCTVGQRSAYMAMHLRQLGFDQVYNIQGSILPLSFYEYYRDHVEGRQPILSDYYLIDHY